MEENQDQNAAQTQADDWSGAEAEFLASKSETGAKPVEEGKSDEQANAEKTDEEKAAEAANSDGKKSDEGEGAGDDSKKKTGSDEEADPNADKDLEQKADEGTPQNDAANYRKVQKEIEADNKAMREDVQKELYPDWTDDILDADGEPLKTPRDVLSHINPNTGKRFTEEEATAWLFAAQEHKDKLRGERDQRVAQISDTMIDQRDQADQVKTKFGELLGKLPELRKEIFADYKATLVVDKETGLIVDAPVSMFNFFQRALRPYEQYAKQLQADATNKQTQQTDTERKQTQQDREDIHSASGGSVTDPEEEAWAKAAKEYYEG